MTNYCNVWHSYCKMWVESIWNVMAHSDAQEGKWRGNWRIEWVASTLHTTSERGLSSITTADAHTSAASSRLNWRPPPADLNRLVRFVERQSGFCACAITFQLASTNLLAVRNKFMFFSFTLWCHICTSLHTVIYNYKNTAESCYLRLIGTNTIVIHIKIHFKFKMLLLFQKLVKYQ